MNQATSAGTAAPHIGSLVCLLLESDGETASDFADLFARRFQAIGYKATILTLSLADVADPEELAKKALEILSQSVVDVVAVDLTYASNNQSNPAGIAILNRIAKLAPDVPRILFSSMVLHDNAQLSPTRTFDFFLTKSQLNTPGAHSYIDAHLRKLVKVNIYGFLDSGSLLDRESQSHSIAISRLLRRATFTTLQASPDVAIGSIRLTPLTGGRSRARVYRMEVRTTANVLCVAGALKLAVRRQDDRTEDAVAVEYEHYQSYVRWYLPFSWRPEVLAVEKSDKLSLLVYTFGFGDDVGFKTVTELLKNAEYGEVELAMERIFWPRYAAVVRARKPFHSNRLAIGRILFWVMASRRATGTEPARIGRFDKQVGAADS